MQPKIKFLRSVISSLFVPCHTHTQKKTVTNANHVVFRSFVRSFVRAFCVWRAVSPLSPLPRPPPLSSQQHVHGPI